MEKRTKYIPAIVTLLGCLAATILTYINQYTPVMAMTIILITLVVFYIAGQIIGGIVEKAFAEQVEEEKTETENEEGLEETEQTEEAGKTEQSEKTEEKA